VTARPIDNELVGLELAPLEWSWTERDLAIYALGVGANVDEHLPYLYEQHGPRFLPGFAATPAARFVEAQFEAVAMRPEDALHADERVTIHRDVPVRASVTTTRKLVEVLDKGSAAVLVWDTETADADGPLFTSRGSVFVLGAGGFGGERGARGPQAPELEGPPDLEAEVPTSRSQAALFRLSGDLNTIHIDPEVAQAAGYERPILHGMCTYGIAGRVVGTWLEAETGAPVVGMYARMSAVVMPGDTLVTRAWRTGQASASFETFTATGDKVLALGEVSCAGKATSLS
jgi:acyl dehydratase